MANEKKYTAREAAIAVLAKADEMLKSHRPNMTKKEEADENEIGTKFEKEEKMPPGEIHPKEHVEGEPVDVKNRIENQQAPAQNPHEQKEGNNPEWGAEPGHYKLAKFAGHIGAKRKMRNQNG